MRTRFFRKGNGYGAYLERTPSEFFSIEEVPDEAAALNRATELSQEVIDYREPMFRVVVIRYGTESDLVFAKAHHLILDGYSLGLIVEEAFKAYLGLPLDPVEMNIDTFIRRFDHVGKPGSFERRDAFLRTVFADPPPIPNFGRKAKGQQTNVNLFDCYLTDDVSTIIPSDQRDAVRRRAAVAGTTEVAMLIAAFAQTIGARGGVDDLIMQVPNALRHDRRLENYVNFVASDVPVRVRLSQSNTLEALAVAIGQGIEQAMEFAPFMDSNYYGEIHDDVVERGSYTTLFVAGSRTVDRWTQSTASAPLQRPGADGELDLGMFKVRPLPDMRVEKANSNELDLRSFVVDGALGLGMTFDRSGFDAAEAADILQDVVDRLTAGQLAADPATQSAV